MFSFAEVGALQLVEEELVVVVVFAVLLLFGAELLKLFFQLCVFAVTVLIVSQLFRIVGQYVQQRCLKSAVAKQEVGMLRVDVY